MVIKKGYRNELVQKLQYRLGLTPDGVFGYKTESCVKDWQKYNNLTVDGIVGNTTWRSIFNTDIYKLSPIGVVIHSMSEYLEVDNEVLTAEKFLKKIGLSVHALVHPSGDVTLITPTDERAFHAGVSKVGNIENLNKHTLGVELLVPGLNTYGEFLNTIETEVWWTEIQISKCVDLVLSWIQKYNISASDVFRHSDVSGEQVRGPRYAKKDPGKSFPWQNFLLTISQKSRIV